MRRLIAPSAIELELVSVTYKLSVTATFRSDLDLRRFPFDHETLEVRIQSFSPRAEGSGQEADAGRVRDEDHLLSYSMPCHEDRRTSPPELAGRNTAVMIVRS